VALRFHGTEARSPNSGPSPYDDKDSHIETRTFEMIDRFEGNWRQVAGSLLLTAVVVAIAGTVAFSRLS
jgi:hypothetical protein